MDKRKVYNCRIAMPVTSKIYIEQRTKELDISLTEYIARLIGNDTNRDYQLFMSHPKRTQFHRRGSPNVNKQNKECFNRIERYSQDEITCDVSDLAAGLPEEFIHEATVV